MCRERLKSGSMRVSMRRGIPAVAVLLALLLFALFLRVVTLSRESVWFDESVATGMDAGTPLPAYLDGVRALDCTMDPLYFSCLWGWCRIFGYSDTAYRSLSLFLGCAALLVLVLAAREFLGSMDDALLAGLLAALSATDVYYSQEIRMYSMFVFLSVTSLWGMARLLRGERGGLTLNISANVLLVWVHLLASILLMIQAAMVLWHFRRDLKTIHLWAVPQILNVMAWWLLWGRSISCTKIIRASGALMHMQWNLDAFCRGWIVSISGLTGSILDMGWLIFAVSTPLILLGLFTVWRRARRDRAGAGGVYLALFALTPAWCFMFSKWVYPIWQPRYTVYAHAGMLILLVLGTGALGRFRRVVQCAVVAVFLAQYLSMPVPARPDWKTIARAVSDRGPVYVYPAFQMPAARKNLPDNPIVPLTLLNMNTSNDQNLRPGWLVAVDTVPKIGHLQERFTMSLRASVHCILRDMDLWRLDTPMQPSALAKTP